MAAIHSRRLRAGVLPAAVAAAWLALATPAAPFGYHSISRDAFPVFDNPRLLTVAEADARGAVLPGDAVIGVVHGGQAKAYPIVIMGTHELGNDTIAGLPIAITW